MCIYVRGCRYLTQDLGDIYLRVIKTLEVKTNFPVVMKTSELDKRLSALKENYQIITRAQEGKTTLVVGLPETIQ